MKDQTDGFDQAEEEILAYDVSDEELEASASTTKQAYTSYTYANYCSPHCK